MGLKEAAKDRDNYTCQKCGKYVNHHSRINAHHIVPLSEGGEDDIENISSLCNQCHEFAPHPWTAITNYEETFREYISTDNRPYLDIFEFGNHLNDAYNTEQFINATQLNNHQIDKSNTWILAAFVSSNEVIRNDELYLNMVDPTEKLSEYQMDEIIGFITKYNQKYRGEVSKTAIEERRENGVKWGRAPFGFNKSNGELEPKDGFEEICDTLQKVDDSELSQNKAASKLNTSRTTIRRILTDNDRRELYNL